MAADAVLKIKEAEEKGTEIIRIANDSAKDIIKNASTEGLKKRNEIIDEANKKKSEIIDAAVKTANDNCKPLMEEGHKDKGKIKHPEEKALKKATDIVIERIVNINGNR